MCEYCIEYYKLEEGEVIDAYYTKIHPHPVKVNYSNLEWVCDGADLADGC